MEMILEISQLIAVLTTQRATISLTTARELYMTPGKHDQTMIF